MEIVIITLVMALQFGIGVYGFYAIRTFERSHGAGYRRHHGAHERVAWTRPGVVNWGLTTSLPPGAHIAMLSLLMTAVGVAGACPGNMGIRLFALRAQSVPSSSVFWYSYAGMFVPSVWLAILGATIASTTLDTDPAKWSALYSAVQPASWCY